MNEENNENLQEVENIDSIEEVEQNGIKIADDVISIIAGKAAYWSI